MYSRHAWPAAACHPALQPGSPVAPHHAAQQPTEKQRQQQCPPEASDCVQAARLHIAVEKVGVHKQSLQGRQGWGRTGRTCRADRVSQQRGLLALSMPAPASQPTSPPAHQFRTQSSAFQHAYNEPPQPRRLSHLGQRGGGGSRRPALLGRHPAAPRRLHPLGRRGAGIPQVPAGTGRQTKSRWATPQAVSSRGGVSRQPSTHSSPLASCHLASACSPPPFSVCVGNPPTDDPPARPPTCRPWPPVLRQCPRPSWSVGGTSEPAPA